MRALFGRPPAWLALAAIAPALLLLAACGDDDDGTGRASQIDTEALLDEEIDLTEMVLELGDLPDGDGFEMVGEGLFSNEEAVEFTEDPERELLRLESFGRIEAFQRAFLRTDVQMHLGKILTWTSQATLYEDATGAQRALEAAVDFPTSGLSSEEFGVRDLGDEAVGLLVLTNSELGVRSDVVVAFRIGRIIGSVTAQGLEGTERPALTVAVACRLEERIMASLTDEEAPPLAPYADSQGPRFSLFGDAPSSC